MLLYASASEAFRGEKGQLVYTKTDLRKKKKKGSATWVFAENVGQH